MLLQRMLQAVCLAEWYFGFSFVVLLTFTSKKWKQQHAEGGLCDIYKLLFIKWYIPQYVAPNSGTSG